MELRKRLLSRIMLSALSILLNKVHIMYKVSKKFLRIKNKTGRGSPFQRHIFKTLFMEKWCTLARGGHTDVVIDQDVDINASLAVALEGEDPSVVNAVLRSGHGGRSRLLRELVANSSMKTSRLIYHSQQPLQNTTPLEVTPHLIQTSQESVSSPMDGIN